MARDRAKEAHLEAHLRLGGAVRLHARGVPSPVVTRPFNIIVGHVRYMTKAPPPATRNLRVRHERSGNQRLYGPPPLMMPGAKYMPSSYVDRDHWSGLLFRGCGLLADLEMEPLGHVSLDTLLQVLLEHLLAKYAPVQEE